MAKAGRAEPGVARAAAGNIL